jgi:hypothetical protein
VYAHRAPAIDAVVAIGRSYTALVDHWIRDRRWQLAAATLLAAVGWLVLWDTTEPRTSWDSLMYHRIALEYVGAPVAEQTAAAWTIFRRYADPEDVEDVEAGIREGGSPWDAMEEPSRERWVDVYRSRPLYALLVAAGYPFVDLRAPLLVSAAAVLLFTVSMTLGVGRVAGYGVGLAAVLFSFANPLLASWLVVLQPDGLAIALWTACLALAALFIHHGTWRWLALLGAAAIALSFTRPLGVFLPLVLGTCTLAALVARRPEWRRLGLGTGAAALATALFTAYSYLLGLPTVTDALQDLPTRHFLRPEVADPLMWTIEVAAAQVVDPLLPTLVGNPALWGPALIGLIGLIAVGRSWALAPFVAAIPILPLAYLIHPQLSEAPRTMAPIWVSVHLGMAMAFVAVVTRLQRMRPPGATDDDGTRDALPA